MEQITQKEKSTPLTDRILLFIAGNNGTASAKSIEKCVTGKNQSIYAALNILVENGMLVKKGGGGRSDPIMYQLKESIKDNVQINKKIELEIGKVPQVNIANNSVVDNIQPSEPSLELTKDDILQIAHVFSRLELFKDKLMNSH